jgi:hypothetical protein
VGLWRELRRLTTPVKQSEIEPARAAADDGDYACFVSAVGGIHVGRRGCLSVWVERTGELSMYDDPRPAVPVGVRSYTQRCRTREGGWRIRWGASTIASLPPWTRVNNCTAGFSSPIPIPVTADRTALVISSPHEPGSIPVRAETGPVLARRFRPQKATLLTAAIGPKRVIGCG